MGKGPDRAVGLRADGVKVLGIMRSNRFALFLAIGLTLFSKLSPQDEGKNLIGAVVQVVTGEAKYQDGDQSLPITKGLSLQENQSIQTGKGGLLLLKLRNGGDLIIYENSKIKLSSEKGKPGRIKLLQHEGFAWSRIPRLKTRDSFIVEMPAATAGIRGTAFSTSIDAQKNSQVCVCEGTVKVSTEQGATILKQGELARTQTGKKAMDRPVSDLTFLKHPTQQTLQCLNCHQGGYSRDGRY